MPPPTYHMGIRKVPFTIVTSMILIFITAVFLHRAYSHGALTDVPITFNPFFPEYSVTLATFLGLYFSYFIEALLTKYHVATPYGAFIVMFSYLWGVWIYHDHNIRYLASSINMFPRELMVIYVSVSVFTIAFNVDVPTFRRTLSQILVIGVPVCLFSSCLFGIISSYIINPTWFTRTGVLLGIFCAPTYPHAVTMILRQQNTKTKQISALLEGESLIEFFISDLCQKLLLGRLEGFVSHWYQYVAVTIRILVLGVISGLSFGYIGRAMIRRLYTNRLSVLLICAGVPIFTYHFSEMYISGCGSIAVILVGLMLSTEKTVLPKEVEKFLTDFWEMAAFFVDVVVLMKVSMISAVAVAPVMSWSDYPLVFVVYLMNFMMRLVGFLVFSPITSRLGYGMDLKSLIVCVWGGIKSSFTLLISSYFLKYKVREREARVFLFYIIGLYFLSVIINGSFTMIILDFLGLKKISLARQVNMNNCIKHIFAKREKTIAILKTDRFLTDANWPMVIENTTMKHPYQLGVKDEEDDGYFLGYRFTWCGDCKKDILQEPTPKEMKEMTREAKMRILKAKKMSYSRQYEMGMMTKQGIISLGHKTEIAMDSEDAEVDIGMMHNKLIEEDCCVRFIRRLANRCISNRQYRRPRTYWRRLCYNVVLKNRNFEKAILSIVAVHIVLIIIDTIYHPAEHYEKFALSHSLQVDYFIVSLRMVFTMVYLVEFVMTILAYSWIRICGHGFKTYFTSFWHVQDFVVLIGIFVGFIYDFTLILAYDHETIRRSWFHEVCDAWRFLRSIKLLKLFQVFYPDLVSFLDKRLDSANAKAFEIGKCYASAEGEILEMLPYMIDNTKIRSDMRNRIERDRLKVYHLLGIIQKERPWVAITVKTTQAIRMILNGMNEAINQLKSSGWVDAYEYEKLATALEELYQEVNAIKKVQPSPPNILFKEVSWMADDDTTIEFLFENVVLRKFEPGEVVFAEGVVADGIYIVVTGLLVLSYVPDDRVLKNLKENGVIPVVDFLNSRNYDDRAIEHVVSGTCIGELSTLTRRPYNCTITSDGHSQAYFISNIVLAKAMELHPDPIAGLDRRIWKEVAVRIAMPIMITSAAYQSFNQDQIKYALERAFVPDLSNFKIFCVTDMIEDVILIEGIVLDFNSREMYIAPCHVPRTAQKIILSQSSQMGFQAEVKTTLLIIPSKDADEYDVMLNAEEICELVNAISDTKCLQHTIQDRKVQRRRRVRSRQKMASRLNAMHSGASSVKHSLFSLDTTASGMHPSTSTLYAREEEEEKEKRAFEYSDKNPEKSTDKTPDKNTGLKAKPSLFFM